MGRASNGIAQVALDPAFLHVAVALVDLGRVQAWKALGPELAQAPGPRRRFYTRLRSRLWRPTSNVMANAVVLVRKRDAVWGALHIYSTRDYWS
jgi:hypothetical protein